jgi:hypothetical protein
LEWQADALEQTHQVQFALDAHLIQHLIGGIFGHPDHEVVAERAEFVRQQPVGVVRQPLELLERGCFGGAPAIGLG